MLAGNGGGRLKLTDGAADGLGEPKNPPGAWLSEEMKDEAAGAAGGGRSCPGGGGGMAGEENSVDSFRHTSRTVGVGPRTICTR